MILCSFYILLKKVVLFIKLFRSVIIWKVLKMNSVTSAHPAVTTDCVIFGVDGNYFKNLLV